MPQTENLRRAALVTGGAKGIGRAICRALAENGMNIAVNYAGSAAAAEETAAACRALGVQAVTLQADVRSPEACQKLVEDTVAAFGRIDVLVNNAGITADKLLLRMTEADFDNVLATNLKGAFFCTKAACRFMMHQRYGRIISVSSVVGLHGNAGQANYAASKAGLIGLTKRSRPGILPGRSFALTAEWECEVCNGHKKETPGRYYRPWHGKSYRQYGGRKLGEH